VIGVQWGENGLWDTKRSDPAMRAAGGSGQAETAQTAVWEMAPPLTPVPHT